MNFNEAMNQVHEEMTPEPEPLMVLSFLEAKVIKRILTTFAPNEYADLRRPELEALARAGNVKYVHIFVAKCFHLGIGKNI